MDEKQEIRDYLMREKGNTEVVAEMMLEKVTRYDDILQEFLFWLQHRNYQYTPMLSVGGYNAKNIYEMAPILDGVGVFNLLVDLRDNPEEAKAAIARGFEEL